MPFDRSYHNLGNFILPSLEFRLFVSQWLTRRLDPTTWYWLSVV